MTQMATETIIEIVVDDLTAHEFETPCDWVLPPHGPCDRPARWACVKACCGGVALWCTKCKDMTILDDGAADCRSCGHTSAPCREMIAHLEPLARG